VELETFFLHGCNGWSVLDKELVMVLKFVLRGLMLAVGLTVASLSGQHVDAAVVNLTTSPTSIAYDASGSINPVSFVEITRSFGQYNDATGRDLQANPTLTGWAVGSENDPIPGTLTFNATLSIAHTTTGINFYAFKFNDGGQDYFGWIKQDFGLAAGSTITILAAAYQSVSGDPIFAGQTAPSGAVPEPATAAIFGLATLVAGARGFKARRKAQAAS